MLGVRGQSNLSHLEERLKMVLGVSLCPPEDPVTPMIFDGCGNISSSFMNPNGRAHAIRPYRWDSWVLALSWKNLNIE
jgi:hypothetical protein